MLGTPVSLATSWRRRAPPHPASPARAAAGPLLEQHAGSSGGLLARRALSPCAGPCRLLPLCSGSAGARTPRPPWPHKIQVCRCNSGAAPCSTPAPSGLRPWSSSLSPPHSLSTPTHHFFLPRRPDGLTHGSTRTALPNTPDTSGHQAHGITVRAPGGRALHWGPATHGHIRSEGRWASAGLEVTCTPTGGGRRAGWGGWPVRAAVRGEAVGRPGTTWRSAARHRRTAAASRQVQGGLRDRGARGVGMHGVSSGVSRGASPCVRATPHRRPPSTPGWTRRSDQCCSRMGSARVHPVR